MDRRKIWIGVALAVLVIAIAASWGYRRSSEGQYVQAITAICGGVANTNQAFAVYAAKPDDFSALKAKCEKASEDLGAQALQLNGLGAKGVPARYAVFHQKLRDLIAGYQGFYTKVAAEAAGWDKTSFEAVETMRAATLLSANACATTWPSTLTPVENNPAWCVTLSVDLKKMADSKKSVVGPTLGSAVFVAGGIPTTGGVVIALPSIGSQIVYNQSAGYVSEMRSLLGGYKQLRGDLDDVIAVYDKGHSITFASLDNAIASRVNIRDAIRNINPPVEYAGAHGDAFRMLANAVDILTAFRNSPNPMTRQALHELSDANTEKMDALKSIYGF